MKDISNTLVVKAKKAEVAVTTGDVNAIEVLNKKGATVEKACGVLNDMMTAETVLMDKDTGELHKTPDHRVRHLGALTVLEIHKVIKDKSIQTSIGIFQDPTIIADAERVLKIKNG